MLLRKNPVICYQDCLDKRSIKTRLFVENCCRKTFVRFDDFSPHRITLAVGVGVAPTIVVVYELILE